MVVTKLLIPKSIPTCLVIGLSFKFLVSLILKDTNHLALGSNLTVILLGIQPSGNCLFHLIDKGSAHLARYTWPSFHLNADLVNSALPPLRFFLKLEYLVRLLKKLVKAVCKCLKPYWSGILLTTG